jgi:hypothetical protein
MLLFNALHILQAKRRGHVAAFRPALAAQGFINGRKTVIHVTGFPQLFKYVIFFHLSTFIYLTYFLAMKRTTGAGSFGCTARYRPAAALPVPGLPGLLLPARAPPRLF